MKESLTSTKFQIKFENNNILWNLFCSHTKHPLIFNKQENSFPSVQIDIVLLTLTMFMI